MLASALTFAVLATTSSVVEIHALDPPTSLAGAPWQCVDDVDGAAGHAAHAPPASAAWHAATLPQPSGAKECTSSDVWFRVDVAVPESARSQPLGVSVGEVRGAYDVYADGEKIGGLGEIDPLVDALRVGAAFSIPHRLVDDGAVQLVVHVVRDGDSLLTTQDHRAIVDGPLAVGHMPGAQDRAVAEVQARVTSETAATLTLLVLFGFIGLYHLLVWFLRKDLRGYAWFGVFALTAGSWTTLVAVAGTELLPITARNAAIIGNLVGSLANLAFIEFLWWFITKGPPPRRWRVVEAALALVSAIGFIPHVGVAWTVSIPVVAFKLLILPWAIVEIVQLARRKNRDARVLLVGMVLAVAGAPAQWFVQSHAIHLPIGPGQAALATFFVAMAVALAAQFARTLDEVDARARELAETNVSIQRFVPFLFLKALDKQSVREVVRGDAAATNMSVMFCDLRGFTTLAEKMGPGETFRFINRYLERMEPEIHKTGGFINQYLGDGIMALFPTGADGAVDAAVGMCRALEALNVERVAAGEPALRVGIGIHTGPLMLGTIGGGDQLDSGVVGDTVNTAARLEGITKMYGATVLISGATMQALKSSASRSLRPLDAVKAKGKSEPLPLVEVLDADPRVLREAKSASRGDLEAALALYRKGQFDDAALRFNALAAHCPDDGAARALAERCRGFVLEPPDAWDGVLSLTTK